MKNKKINPLFNSKTDIYCFSNNINEFKQLVKGGAGVIQLRDKKMDDNSFKSIACEMLSIIKNTNTKLIINDRVDIAISVNAHGVHIGKDDENLENVLQKIPDNMIAGISVDTLQEAVNAEKQGADYIGAGAVFKSKTKPDAFYMGINTLKEIIKYVKIPVVAIGGINIKNIMQVKNAGAKYFAIISDINKSNNIKSRLNQFFNIIGKES